MAKVGTQKYFSIELASLVVGRTLTFDLFIFLPLNERIVLYRPKGQSFTRADELESLKAKGLKLFHLRNEDREAFERYLVGGDDQVAMEVEALDYQTRPEAPPRVEPEFEIAAEPPIREEKVVVAATAVEELEPPPPPKEFVPEVAPEQVVSGLLAKEESEKTKAVREAKAMVKQIMANATNGDPTINDMIEHPAAEHATTVAIYCVLFAMGLGKRDQFLLQDFVLASLLHDIGVTQIPPELLAIPEIKHTPQQRAEYVKHVEFGISLLGELDYKPNKRVFTLLDQHHEKFDGTGFPHRFNSFRVDEDAQVMAFADLVDSICRGHYDGTVRSLPDALRVVAEIEKQTTFPQYFNPDLFKKIMNWLKSGGGEDYLAEATNTVEQAKEKLLKAG